MKHCVAFVLGCTAAVVLFHSPVLSSTRPTATKPVLFHTGIVTASDARSFTLSIERPGGEPLRALFRNPRSVVWVERHLEREGAIVRRMETAIVPRHVPTKGEVVTVVVSGESSGALVPRLAVTYAQ